MAAKRILVLSAAVGAGHVRAAQAVEMALRELDPAADVRYVDVLDLTGSTFRRLYAKAYSDLVERAPHLLGYLYDLLDRQPSPQRKSDRFRLLMEKLNLRKFLRFLQVESWDVVVNTHFLLENGAAVKINNIATLPFKLGRLLADEGRLAQLKRNAKRLGRPRAAYDVAKLALEWADR